MFLWEVGEIVRNTLAKRPGAFKVPATGLEIYVVRNFLSAQECAGLIKRIDSDLKPSGLLADEPDPEFRTSQTCDLQASDSLVNQIDHRIAHFLGLPAEYAETLQGQRYAVGQQFKPHHDFFYTDQPYFPAQEKVGGQRTWTAMGCLNDVSAGGQTYFERAGVRITPKTGNLIIWNNLDLAGEPNTYSLHQGMPVEAGTKYIVTKWFRGRKWGYE
ncbi:MAG TPA: 2OG-Fe(II) oxygenase [Allosphingosinicella sp.]|jgi:prolyl 4-hydroxylase|uniref:prolyl hydroxylase family protein n=1 Tax=Allosphingosinicella sp. TaxID=2823234 RepID=UPI002F29A481